MDVGKFTHIPKRLVLINRVAGQKIARYWILIFVFAAGFCLLLSHVSNVVSTPPPFAIVRTSNIFLHRNTQSDEGRRLKSIISEDDICNKGTFLLIAVCVSSSNFKQRSVIRNTWGSIVSNNNRVKLAFFLGNPNDTKIQQAIWVESERYHDIVQDNFVDSYRNLTLKSIFILKWSSTFCVDASYVLKADDDMFINVPYLINYLNTTNIHNAVIGQRIAASKPIRNKKSKWFTSESMYRDKYYPYYTSGTSYVISGDVVTKLYQSTFIEPFFWLEDVYITGLCRKRINASIIDNWDFSCLYRPPRGCSYKQAISGHRNSPEEITQIWLEMNDPRLNCSV
ncbi:beta-1,3-galactosyltransferase 1-like [Mizuhopecten yessoensis]|uniref:Hexosyltransferase n=1 Tax=Mizuhopecten yessoensis TaxID=6573 RepID=A0A210QH79_MIZYE|nr:beta-1,3-galactosyltransferase 1-like [Mizuhopecten yessoensis]OWF48077.1 Lactosylceramide 1,3-N-acetyl-beta-D-glucosaminyltransferase [Mizuhopecten yessoensis]